MANRRMFSMKIVDTDAFMDISQTAQSLYFHLAMRADDDGFIANPKKIMKMIGSQDDDYKILCIKKFIIPFNSGICVIKHWLIHNLIRGDRYTQTQYIREKDQLKIHPINKKYSLNKGNNENVIPNGNQRLSQVRLGKDSIGKDSIDKDNIKNIEIFSYKGYLEKMSKNPSNGIKIIALYAKEKNIIWENIDQAQSFIRRNLRASGLLKGYELLKIQEVMKYLKLNADFKWTLETITKYIDEDLNNLTTIKKFNEL